MDLKSLAQAHSHFELTLEIAFVFQSDFFAIGGAVFKALRVLFQLFFVHSALLEIPILHACVVFQIV